MTNQRTRKNNVDMEDTEDTGDIVVDTVYLKEGKAVKESMTRNHLIRRTILNLSLSLRTILRIVLAMINVPFAGRRAITRQTAGNTRSISQCA